QIVDVGAFLFGDRRVVCPHSGIAVGLKLGAHPGARCALRAGTVGPPEHTTDVLYVMPELVGHHVLLRQRPTAGTELVPEYLEESDIEVCGFVSGAVERADRTVGGPASGVDWPGEQLDLWSSV